MVSGHFFALTVIFMVVVVPIFLIMHYTTKWKAAKGLSDEEQATLEELWQTSQRMDSRLNALETILDAEVPDWRRKL
jgi:phage shock protein B